MTPEKYFKSVQFVNKKRYDALHDFFVNHLSAKHQNMEPFISEISKKQKDILKNFGMEISKT